MKVRIIFFLISTFLVIYNLELASQGNHHNQDFADSLFQVGNYQGALTEYERCFAADTTLLECELGTAVAAKILGDLFLAKKSYLHLERDSNYADVVNKALASLYELEQNRPKAIKYYHRLNRADTLNALYLRKLGQLYHASGLSSEAFGYFGKAHQINQNDFYTISGLADIYIKNDQNAEADSLLEIALLRDSTNVNLNLVYARSNYQQKKYAVVTQILERIVGRVGLSSYYGKMIGYSYMQIDSLDDAIYYLSKSLSTDSNPENALYFLAIAHDKKKDFVSAEHFYSKAIESGISKNLNIYYRQMARLAMGRKDLKSAIKNYEEANRYKPKADLLFKLARLYDDYYKDKSVAVRHYQMYISSNDDDPKLLAYSKERIIYLKSQQHMKN